MGECPVVVTNENNRDAPADLVVLEIDLKELTQKQTSDILALDWYVPDAKIHQEFSGIVMVRWDKLNKIKKGTKPSAPADFGLDNLKAVMLVPNEFHCARLDFYTTFTQGK